MTELIEILARIDEQFLDPHQLALTRAAKTEAVREALEYINSACSQSYTLTGLDGSVSTTLPADYLPPLLRGAAGALLRMVLQNKFASLSNLPLQAEELAAWTRYLFQERDALLDHLRLANLRQGGQPWARWTLDERNAYD